jgi:hypothetical protein
MAQNPTTVAQAQQQTGTAGAASAGAASAGAAPAAAGQGFLGRAVQATKAAFGNQGAQAAQNTDMLAKAMLKQWNTKAAQLANAAAASGAGTVSDQEYKDQLEDFVEKNMLQKQIDELDSTSTQRMNQMITKVVASRNNSSQLDQAFRDMAKITTTARMDPSLRRFGGRAAATPTAAQGQPGAQQAPQATAQTLMPSSAQQTNVLAHFGGRGARFQSTNNDNVDAFLQQLGLRMTP